jgi:hypothetical protein|tara:strand:+ start:321 stop:506 length:186 start_codon:yes stop_codon:yes gene_type:complete
MSKLDTLISKFFDNLRQGRVDSFTKDILKDPKARQAVKNLKKIEDDLLKHVTKHYKESLKK